MVRKLPKTKTKSAVPTASTSVKTSSRKNKSEEMLSNGYDDNQNENAESKTDSKTLEIKASGSADSNSEAQTDMNENKKGEKSTEVKTSDPGTSQSSKETNSSSEKQENMEVDSVKPVKEKTEEMKDSKEPKASQKGRKRKMATTKKEVAEKAVPRTKAKRQKESGTVVKTSSKKVKSEGKLSKGYDNKNENAESKTDSKTLKVKASGSANSNFEAQIDVHENEKGEKSTEVKPGTSESTKKTNSNSRKRRNMLQEPVKQEKKVKMEDSEEQKASQRSHKRKMATTKKEVAEKEVPRTKRQKIMLEIPQISSVSGKVFVMGENDVGQLGLGEDITERKRPTLLDLPYSFVDIAAGGMHSVCLTESGEVITFGCNDEGALGRITSEEGSEMIPQRIDITERIVQVSAGDSHSAALSESGQVYAWGNFRNGNGPMGLVNDGAKQCLPVKILNDITVVKISSGSDHLVCLSQEGIIYTCGCGDAGQLGRFTERALEHGDRSGRSFISRMLLPEKVPVGKSNKSDLVNNIWTGTYATFASAQESGQVYAFGLNNYNQLGIRVVADKNLKLFKPAKVPSFNGKLWLQISGGQHHTIALDDNGKVHSLGRAEYGRLGLGENTEIVSEPTVIPLLEDIRCTDISSGNCVSLAVADNGSVYSWGMGDSHQLGHGNDNDQHTPRLVEGNFFNSWKAFKISGGGQHTLILANPRESLEESQ